MAFGIDLRPGIHRLGCRWGRGNRAGSRGAQITGRVKGTRDDSEACLASGNVDEAQRILTYLVPCCDVCSFRR